MVSKSLRHPDLEPAHPGEFLGEVVIPATAKSKVEVAGLLGVSRQTLYDIINGVQGVTPAVALKLGKLFGNGPELWLNMQAAHDLWHARRALAADLERMPTLQASGAR